MIDSMILWLMICIFIYFTLLSLYFLRIGLYEPGGILGGMGPKMCETRVLGGFGRSWGALGGKPWFYTFWGF
jgi:hypothetical protein